MEDRRALVFTRLTENVVPEGVNQVVIGKEGENVGDDHSEQ